MVTVADRRRAIHEVLGKIKHRDPADRLAATDAIRMQCGGKAAPALMMQQHQVRALRDRGMDIGAHTVTHPILTRLSSTDALKEMQDSKMDLEQILQSRVALFAYPNGVPGRDYSSEHASMARKCGYEAAVSTAWGAASRSADRYQLPRFTPWDRTRFRFGARMFMNLLQKPLVAA
jgi:peptidoglycan/xylan/chitin deacetylase (PgdA/CDA1 family)